VCEPHELPEAYPRHAKGEARDPRHAGMGIFLTHATFEAEPLFASAPEATARFCRPQAHLSQTWENPLHRYDRMGIT